MTPDQRRESIGLSHMNLSDEDKTKAYTLEEFSYDYFRCVAVIQSVVMSVVSNASSGCYTSLLLSPSWSIQGPTEEHTEQSNDL